MGGDERVMGRPEGSLRVAEVLGALASAADLANGFAFGKVLRTSILASGLARLGGHGDEVVAESFFLSQLRYLGCTAFAHEEGHRYGAGDDIALRHTMAMVDGADKLGALSAMWSGFAPEAGTLAKAAGIARLVTSGAVNEHANAQCNGAMALARIAGMDARLVSRLESILERWDGLGAPNRLKGEDIPTATRIHNFADIVEIAHHRGGLELARAVVLKRRGGQLDPTLCDLFLAHADELDRALSTSTLWEDFLAAEPGSRPTLDASRLDGVTRALGYFADLKSPWLLGHSQRVSELAERAGEALGCSGDDREILRWSGHLHDLGRVAVPTRIWDREGPLGALEWAQVRLHTQHTEQILALSPALLPLCSTACAAHEEPRGAGYHRRLREGQLDLLAQVLHAADAVAAMGEARPHRPALGHDRIVKTLRAEVAEGRFDKRSVEVVLEVAGLVVAAQRNTGTLSDREREVLVWVARGKTNKEIGIILGISAKTVQHHVAHVYDKIGVCSRAGAAIWAMERRLIG